MCRIIHKSILRINKNTLEVKEYINRYSASLEGFNSSKIGICLKTKYNTYKGYFWFYKEEFNNDVLLAALERNKQPKRKKELIRNYKICTKCKLQKDLFDFGSSPKGKYGKHSQCKKCRMIYNKNRRKIDKLWQLKVNLRCRTYNALKIKNWRKNNTFKQYIGCKQEELLSYLESKFIEGMTWDNYGEWHIDHIIPLSIAKTEDELYKLCHYTNLQPLWAIDNIKKGGSHYGPFA